MGIYVLIRPPPCYLLNRKIVNNQPAPHPFMLGAQPEFPKNKRREGKISKSLDFIRELLVVKSVRIDMVPFLPYFHHPNRFTFEDQEVKHQIVILVFYGEIPIRSANSLASAIAASGFLPRVMDVLTSSRHFWNYDYPVSGMIRWRLNALWSPHTFLMENSWILRGMTRIQVLYLDKTLT